MSRSPKDSTRFTATGVWAHTRPGGRATTLQFADPAPKNETPQQKVKRLREAANRAKMAQVTRWDYMYLYGRMAADAAHRFTVYGLIFATGCIGVLAVFSIGDMIVYNRRKRAIYFAEEERTQAKILELARTAVAEGTASPAQAALVTGIAEEQELMDKKKAERKMPSRLLWWAHGDWKEEKEIEEQRRLAVEEIKKQELRGGQGVGIAAAVQEARANSTLTSASTPVVGGPLDNTAEKAAQKVEQTGKGWLGWMMGGSKKE
ncbi:cytochrome oxidase c assembly-domain-containing protein [Pyrenochaeta sp. MPI-SDFR-AT-0127]|nr:cytochrome oxidase c assembly-domain-containing protein [Pyrenochaeta sp. MPI-SDFR-AT-0127]